MKVLTALVAFAVALAAPLTAANAPPLDAPAKVLPPEFARLDPDGGRTLMLTIDDGEGGVWRTFPVSDAGIAAFTNALQAQNVRIDPVFAAHVREVGAFVHMWTLDGTPYVTLGTYVRTDSQGLLRMPVLILENVSDLQGVADIAASVVADDAMPLAAEAIPHVYAIGAPDLLITGLVAGIATLLLGVVAYIVVASVESIDMGTGAANLPPEAYPPLKQVSLSLAQMGFPIIYGQFGLGGTYDDGATAGEHNLTHDWVDRPEIRLWTARKIAAGHDVWSGAALSRTGGASGDGVAEFHAWKRLSIGPAARIDGVVTTPAAVYLRGDVDRHYADDGPSNGPSEIENHYVLTAGVAANGQDTPLAQMRMDEWRDDDGDEGSGGWLSDWGDDYGISEGEATYLPDEQEAHWSVGTVVGGAFVPLVGARTNTWHRAHHDVTNQGAPVFEWESERISSAGVYVLGEYTPIVGARTWVERSPIEFYAVVLALDGLGSQIAGDAEASVGTFVQGVYTPLAGARYDDDFALHLHVHRGMVSAGTYLEGDFMPLLGATYDGEDTLTNWTLGSGERTRWQTSVGTFTLGFYRPILGTRYVPETHSGAGVHQESYQIGVYPLHYDPFIPVASVDYDGEHDSLSWAVGLASGSSGVAAFDAVAYTPGPYAFPLAGARYVPDAPDMNAEHEFHLALGAYSHEGVFVPLVGVSYASQAWLDELALSVVGQVAGGPRHEEARVSVGAYHPQTGAYMPVATVNTASSPV